jgi:hypothetical protein
MEWPAVVKLSSVHNGSSLSGEEKCFECNRLCKLMIEWTIYHQFACADSEIAELSSIAESRCWQDCFSCGDAKSRPHGGNACGTSRREDVLDMVIQLKHREDVKCWPLNTLGWA